MVLKRQVPGSSTSRAKYFYDFESWHPLPPSLLSIKFFDTKNFWKTEGLPYEIFLGTVRQNISMETSDTPFLCIKIFDTRNIEGFPHEIFRHCETKTQKHFNGK